VTDGLILDEPWAKAPATQAVMAALTASGGPDCARFVGGCVRNALLRRPVDDVDIATTLVPDQTMRALTAAGVKWVPTGVEHGTVTAISHGRPYEITTLRRDVATDGRRAVVAFSLDWAEDAARRDFRLNALYMDGAGRVFDPLGQGVDDAMSGRIVFVGDPMTRIREDYLRILRFFRFLAWYGRGAPDPAALAACAALRDLLADRPGERISKELLKLLAADDPRSAARLMRDAGVLDMVMPVAGLERLEALVGLERDALGETDAALRLLALMPQVPSEVARAAERLRLSNADRDRLLAALAAAPPIAPSMDAHAVRRLIYKAGKSAARDRIKLAWAAAPQAPGWRALLQRADACAAPVFPLTGQDAIAAGLAPGPVVGRALKAVEAWWIDQDFPDDRPLALAHLSRVAHAMGEP